MIEEPIAPNQPQVSAVIEWLVRELSQSLNISQEAIATNEPFSHFGLDSAKAISLLNRLGKFIGRKIPVTLAWKYPTIEALANYLCGKSASPARELPSPSFRVAAWNEPIAVIGMACRFPGAADPAAFWGLLRSGRSAFREITPDRWDINAWYDSDPTKPGKMNARMAGLLERIDQFDADFFGVSPREATQMDPQQRLALELTWEALEDGGVRPDVLRGSRTGLFVGVVWHDYETIARKAGAEITAHSGTGQASSIVANRISYAFGLQGPSIALDTACSSSLVSVHLACRSLQAGDATLAIAGGVNMIIDPDTMVALSKFGGLSPTSELRAFDDRANGFVRGEGGGFVVLKSLKVALADGDPIYAIIRGTAVNNDGASNGLTAPNPAAQETLLREACARASLEADDIQYVEAHGTGTPLGDPIEAHALGNVFGRARVGGQPLLIGSVKTNIGHLEGASGIAGLIKLVLSIHHRQIPPSLNFERPNPHIDFAGSQLRVVTKLAAWPESRKPAVGGVSAFGWGGTNCHLIVEEAFRSTSQLLVLCASDGPLLEKSVKKLKVWLESNAVNVVLRDVCATAAARNTAEPERVALTARSMSELRGQVEGFLSGQKRPGVAIGKATTPRPKLAFIFSPQGSQWLGMGRSLMADEPAFRSKLSECDRALRKLAGWSLINELLATSADSRLNRAEFVQPLLFGMQVALAELWKSWGIRPDFVAAHSLGEWAAACVAGALSLEEAMRVVVESSRVQTQAGEGGGMAVVELTEAEIRERIRNWPREVFIAGFNSPTSTILSGDVDRLNSLVTTWKEEGVICSLIDVNVAAHSPYMECALQDLVSSLIGLRSTRVAIPFLSSVHGDYLTGTEMGPEHWARHLRQPVLFAQVIERLVDDGCSIFLEISPHPLLTGGIRQTLISSGGDGLALSSCRRGEDERGSLLNSLGCLYALGWPVDWPSVTQGDDNISLPIPAPRQARTPIDTATEPPLLLPLSGHTLEALRDRARSLSDHLRLRHDLDVRDIAYVAAARREHLEHRLALVATRREELSSALEAFARHQDPVNLASGRVHSTDPPKVAFVCSGQGAQWFGMGRELLATMPIFRREIAQCADEIRRYATWDLIEELARDEASSRIGETEIAQPALFALQIGLAAVWRSWGIEPHALVGHSVGEVAAAYLGGALSFYDAIKVICHRGRLMQQATGLGKMAAIELPEADVEGLLETYRDRVSLAAINSPTSIVISGETAAINEIVAAVRSRGVRSKILPVNYAFHSPQMEPFGREMAEAVSGLTGKAASIPVYSTVTGSLATEEDFDAPYWARNIRQTVRFAAAIGAMLDAGISSFVELSPNPVLSSMALQCAATLSRNVQLLPSLRQGQPERFQMLKSLSSLFATGAEIDWRGVYPQGGRIVPLPLYPWQRKRFWLDLGIPLKAHAQPVQPEAPGNWFYDVRWEEKPRAEDRAVRAVTRRLPSPEALQATVEPLLAGLVNETRLVHNVEARNAIEKLAAGYATAAIMRLGFEVLPFRRFTPVALGEQLGILPRHTRLFTRMLDILVEEGLIERSGARFETTPAFQTVVPSLLSLANQTDSLRRKYKEFATEFELLGNCGEQLSGVLRGEVDPLQLLFPADGSVNAERLYRDSPSARFYNRLVGELAGRLVQAVSRRDTVRLLELGAGTGSTTDCVLQRISGNSTYCFTDISPMLLKEAGARFGRSPMVRYAILNIEKPLEDQRFSAGSFDIVLAANVLHATLDLRTSLKHVRQLLAPGGMLLLLETTASRRWLDLVFGLTEGWWRFADTDLRPENALLGVDQWLASLRNSGFQATAAVGAEFSEGDLHQQTVLLAQADDSFPEPIAPTAKKRPLSAAGKWLVFSDAGELAQQVAQKLEQAGGECVLVQASGHFDRSNPKRPTIDIDEPEDYHRLLQDGTLWRGILHAFTLDATFDGANALSDLNRAENLGCRSALFLVQALVKMEKSNLPKLWLLTRGAQPAWSQISLNSIGQAPIWGLGRTIALEHPEFWGGIIDIATDGNSQVLAERIVLEMCLPDGEDQIGLSDDLRLVPRLLETPAPRPMPVEIKSDACYLVTGGLGGLGPFIAGWLVNSGARDLILCGRREIPERSKWGEMTPLDKSYEQVAAIQNLERQGATVHVEQVDVASRGQMETLFQRLHRSSVPLRGIIHAAADIRFCALREMSGDALHAAMRAKVEGAWLLHELSSGFPLDFFVLFSSIASLFGASRIGHYASANQFMDFLAHWRREEGLPALSVNWGAWEEIRSLREKRDEGELFALKAMPAHLALQALSSLTTEGVAQRMVADVDWDLLKPAVESRGRLSFFEHIRTKPGTDERLDADGKSWIEQLERTAPEDRRELLFSLVAGVTRGVLGLRGDEQFDLDRGLFELGLDSLMSVQLKGRLEQLVGRALPATLTFTYPTVRALADFLLDQVLNLSVSSPAEVTLRRESSEVRLPDKDLADLSDDEIKDMLSAELSSLSPDMRD